MTVAEDLLHRHLETLVAKTFGQCEKRREAMPHTKAATDTTYFRCFPDTIDPRGPKGK